MFLYVSLFLMLLLFHQMVVENNMQSVLELSSNGYQIENLGYDGKYSLERFGWTNNMISSLTNEDTKFCYTDYKNSEILELCSNKNVYINTTFLNDGKEKFIELLKKYPNKD